MTALAQVFNQPLTENCDIVRHDTILANTRIYAGTLAINDSGVIKIYTAALYAGGAKLLGFPVTNVFNDTGSNVTDSRKFAFRRNCPMIVAPKSGMLLRLAMWVVRFILRITLLWARPIRELTSRSLCLSTLALLRFASNCHSLITKRIYLDGY